jgi:hypothetical protein
MLILRNHYGFCIKFDKILRNVMLKMSPKNPMLSRLKARFRFIGLALLVSVSALPFFKNAQAQFDFGTELSSLARIATQVFPADFLLEIIGESLSAGVVNPASAGPVLESLKSRDDLSLEDEVRLGILEYDSLGASAAERTLESTRLKVAKAAAAGIIDQNTLYTLHQASSHPALASAAWQGTLSDLWEKFKEFLASILSRKKVPYQQLSMKEISEIYLHQNGAKSSLYLFCRHIRKYPCMMVLKDQDGSTWSTPASTYALFGRTYNEVGGYTPSGVYRINGVMPNADVQWKYGYNRRLKIEFVGRSAGEAAITKLIPPSSRTKNWWKEAVTARDMGREALRIHGTGLHNYFPFLSYYPFIPARGCVSMREGNYWSGKYDGTRTLMDQLMKSQGLAPKVENETKISSLLYIVEIDNERGAVTMEDLAQFGIR